LAVNKIDLVEFSERVFRDIVATFAAFAKDLGFAGVTAIPLSARFGDNVIARSAKMPWFEGPALLPCLEAIDVSTAGSVQPFRMPVQWVNRPNLDFRGFSGTIVSGRVRPGDVVAVAKSGRTSRVARIVSLDGDAGEAVAGEAVTLTLADEIDISRGDV